MKHILLSLLVVTSLAVGCSSEEGSNNQSPNTTSNATTNNTTSNATTNNTSNACLPGQVGCACTAEDSCQGEAMCVEGICVGAQAAGLSFSSPEARSCEVLLEERAGARVLEATYNTGVLGALRRRAPNVALALSSTEDAALPSGAAVLKVDGALSDVSIKQVSCFDKLGNAIDGAEATLQ